MDFKLWRNDDVRLRVKCNEGILRRHIEIRQCLNADYQLTADVIKDGVVEDEPSESDFLQSLFLADFTFKLKSGKHYV